MLGCFVLVDVLKLSYKSDGTSVQVSRRGGKVVVTFFDRERNSSAAYVLGEEDAVALAGLLNGGASESELSGEG